MNKIKSDIYEKSESIEFENKINELKQLYKINPKGTMNLLNKVINGNDLYQVESNRLGTNKLHSNFNKIIHEIGLHKILYIILITCIVLVGFINIGENIALHFFGLIFFFAGFFVSFSAPVVGLIFFFSHGMTGYALMLWSILSTNFYEILFSDMPLFVRNYFIILIILVVLAIFVMVFYNLSKTLKQNKYIPLISLALFLIVLVFLHIFPHIYPNLINIF